MRKLLLPAMVVASVSALALFSQRAEAAAASAPAAIRATVGNTSIVEEVRCWRRRVCGPRGCWWRTTCRRW
jgi:hypothetical protein